MRRWRLERINPHKITKQTHKLTTNKNENIEQIKRIIEETNMTSINEYNQMLATLSQVNQLCMEAQRYYQQALQLQEKGRYANKGGEIEKWGGCLAATFVGHEGFEVLSQAKRSKYMKRSIASANKASEILHRAFALIPRGCLLRQRYPQQMSQIGTTPIPSLDGDNLGENLAWYAVFGDAAAWSGYYEKKEHIKRNLEVLQACSQICGEQQNLLGALTYTIEAHMRQQEQLRRGNSAAIPVAIATPVQA